MSEEERRRIAARGSGFIEGKGEITDKGAKDFKEGMGSIATAAKMGAFTMMYDMYKKLLEVTGALKPFIDLFELFSASSTAESAEAIARLYENLFSERTLEGMNRFAKGVGGIATVTIDGYIAMEDFIQKGKPFRDAIMEMGSGLDTINKLIELNTGEISILSGALGHLLYIIQQVTEAINKMPSGGGGGGDDDDEGWGWDFGDYDWS